MTTSCIIFFDTRAIVLVTSHALSYHVGAVAVSGKAFGEGTLPFSVIDAECSGSEQVLAECVLNTQNGYICDPFSDAGVVCQGML